MPRTRQRALFIPGWAEHFEPHLRSGKRLKGGLRYCNFPMTEMTEQTRMLFSQVKRERWLEAYAALGMFVCLLRRTAQLPEVWRGWLVSSEHLPVSRTSFALDFGVSESELEHFVVILKKCKLLSERALPKIRHPHRHPNRHPPVDKTSPDKGREGNGEQGTGKGTVPPKPPVEQDRADHGPFEVRPDPVPFAPPMPDIPYVGPREPDPGYWSLTDEERGAVDAALKAMPRQREYRFASPLQQRIIDELIQECGPDQAVASLTWAAKSGTSLKAAVAHARTAAGSVGFQAAKGGTPQTETDIAAETMALLARHRSGEAQR